MLKTPESGSLCEQRLHAKAGERRAYPAGPQLDEQVAGASAMGVLQ
jgi:hypothetical protein